MSYLDLIHLDKAFDGVIAVRDFNLQVEQGEFVSLLGPSGCGKTTTLRMVAGFETPNKGSIFLAGTDITSVPPNYCLEQCGFRLACCSVIYQCDQ